MSCCGVDTLGGVPVGAPDPSPLALLKERWDFTMWDEREQGWLEVIVAGGTVVDSNGQSRHPGIIAFNLAVTASSAATYRRSITWAETDDGYIEFDSIYQIVTAIPDAATPGENYTIDMGFGDTNFTPQNDGFSFLLNSALGSANWFAQTNSTAGGTTSVDTGIAPDLNWHRFRARCNVDATSVEFFIDEVSVAIIALTIPAAGELFGDVITHTREAVLGAAPLVFNLDYWSHTKEIVPARP